MGGMIMNTDNIPEKLEVGTTYPADIIGGYLAFKFPDVQAYVLWNGNTTINELRNRSDISLKIVKEYEGNIFFSRQINSLSCEKHKIYIAERV
jgi:hypothetical protein